jgi:release factor glutamine methyltransferase
VGPGFSPDPFLTPNLRVRGGPLRRVRPETSMDTIGTARAWAAQELRRAAVESATLAADLLLGHVLGCDRVQVVSRPEALLPGRAWDRYRALVQRMAKGEPLQYLTGEREFFGLQFRVTPDVLIPRPETEILVEQAVRLARECRSRPVRLADVGTGSGCIAVSVAHEIPDSVALAVDVSLTALALARENAARNAVLARVPLLCCDLLDGLPPQPFFDFILSNPPYVARTEYNSLPATVRDYEPHVALFAGESGLDVFRRLIPQAVARLLPRGYLLVEVGAGQAGAVTQIMLQDELSIEDVLGDLQGIQRCVVSRKKGKIDG